jgi:hypothetical protein
MEFLKDGFGRFLQRARGLSPAQSGHFLQTMTAAGLFLPRGFDADQASYGLLASLGATISHAAKAGTYYGTLKCKASNSGMPENTTLGEALSLILKERPEDISRSGWQLTVMTNPAEAEITTERDGVRKFFRFSAPPTDRVGYSSIRSARIVPAHVLAELADLLANGETAEVRHAKTERPSNEIRL